MSEEAECYYSDYSIAWNGDNHCHRSSEMTDNEQDYEDFKRCGLDACRVDDRLVQDVVYQLCKAEYRYEYGREYPEIDICCI